MVTSLMMSAKMATLGLLKIKVFRNIGYDVIILFMTSSKISCDSNFIVDLVMRPKFGNSRTSMREVITSIL